MKKLLAIAFLVVTLVAGCLIGSYEDVALQPLRDLQAAPPATPSLDLDAKTYIGLFVSANQKLYDEIVQVAKADQVNPGRVMTLVTAGVGEGKSTFVGRFTKLNGILAMQLEALSKVEDKLGGRLVTESDLLDVNRADPFEIKLHVAKWLSIGDVFAVCRTRQPER